MEDAILSQWGAPGAVILLQSAMIWVLYRTKEEMVKEYVTLLKTVLEQQNELTGTLERLVDNISVQDLIQDLISNQQGSGS
jgi:hypothetical protein